MQPSLMKSQNIKRSRNEKENFKPLLHILQNVFFWSFNLLAMPFIAGKANLNWFIKSPFIQFKHLLNVMETARSALKWYELINMLIRRYIFLHILAICRIRAHTMKILLTIFLSVHDNSLHHKHQTVKRVFPI